jgi:carbamoyl-phosphate synthase small subunit
LTKKAKKTNSKNSQIHTGVLVLENKKVFKGIGIGYQGEATGEVCFNTSLTGYQEIISDPLLCWTNHKLYFPTYWKCWN